MNTCAVFFTKDPNGSWQSGAGAMRWNSSANWVDMLWALWPPLGIQPYHKLENKVYIKRVLGDVKTTFAKHEEQGLYWEGFGWSEYDFCETWGEQGYVERDVIGAIFLSVCPSMC